VEALSDVIHLIEFQMSLFLFVALAGYLLASRINQSAVVGEILVGLLVGPSVLGLVTYTSFVAGIAQLGAVFLLFVIGTEFRLEDIARPRYLLIGASGVVVPWALGYLTSALFGFDFGGSAFIGTALTATSIAITANVLKEMGKLKTEAARAIIGAAVIDDVLGLLVLAISKGLVSGSVTVGSIAVVFAKALSFLVAGGLVGHFLLRRLMAAVDRTAFTRRFPEVTFLFAAMLAFLYAMAAEMLGLSAIVGAFMAGASLGGVPLRQGRNLHDGFDFLQIIFASIFFVSLGVLADVRALEARVLLFLLVLTIVAFASKLLGCGGAALLTGGSARDAAVIGFGMAPRGEVAMIIGLIGLDSGLITQGTYVTIILMSLLTTVATPFMLKVLLRRSRPRAAPTTGGGGPR
jgi:Kef-type K+ transport system membrane component KefB